MNVDFPYFKLPASFNDMPPKDAAQLLDLLAPDVEEYAAEAAAIAIEETLIANFGRSMGRAIFADLTGAADAPNSELVKGTVTRAAVSKAATRIRRGFGLPVRCPNNARDGAKAKQAPGATAGPAEDPYGGIPWKHAPRVPSLGSESKTKGAATPAPKPDFAKSTAS